MEQLISKLNSYPKDSTEYRYKLFFEIALALTSNDFNTFTTILDNNYFTDDEHIILLIMTIKSNKINMLKFLEENDFHFPLNPEELISIASKEIIEYLLSFPSYIDYYISIINTIDIFKINNIDVIIDICKDKKYDLGYGALYLAYFNRLMHEYKECDTELLNIKEEKLKLQKKMDNTILSNENDKLEMIYTQKMPKINNNLEERYEDITELINNIEKQDYDKVKIKFNSLSKSYRYDVVRYCALNSYKSMLIFILDHIKYDDFITDLIEYLIEDTIDDNILEILKKYQELSNYQTKALNRAYKIVNNIKNDINDNNKVEIVKDFDIQYKNNPINWNNNNDRVRITFDNNNMNRNAPIIQHNIVRNIPIIQNNEIVENEIRIPNRRILARN